LYTCTIKVKEKRKGRKRKGKKREREYIVQVYIRVERLGRTGLTPPAKLVD